MKNLLFFLWMLFAPIVEDMAQYIVFKTKGHTPGDEKSASWAYLFFFLVVGYLLYER